MDGSVRAQSYSPPSTKDVLGEHLHQKVTEILSENLIDSTTTVYNGCTLANKITGMLLERSLKSIHALLQDDKLLLENMRPVLMVLHKEYSHLPKSLPPDTIEESCQKLSRGEIGEMLFEKICSMEEPMAAQITGMLLELDVQTLHGLISSDAFLLETAVKKAKEVLEPTSPSSLKSSSPQLVCADRKNSDDGKVEHETTKESLGQQLYDRILKEHPDCVSDLTGMILEMDLFALKLLMGDEQQLEVAIARAYTEWTKHSCHRHS